MNKLFSTRQLGFIKGKSTVLQLLQILDDWTLKLENGGQMNVNVAFWHAIKSIRIVCPLFP